jgi:hypothetical protein
VPRNVTQAPREGEPEPKKLDTVALVERRTAPREISTRLALVVIAVVSILAGLTTYAVRVRSGGAGDSTPSRAIVRGADSARP